MSAQSVIERLRSWEGPSRDILTLCMPRKEQEGPADQALSTVYSLVLDGWVMQASSDAFKPAELQPGSHAQRAAYGARRGTEVGNLVEALVFTTRSGEETADAEFVEVATVLAHYAAAFSFASAACLVIHQLAHEERFQCIDTGDCSQRYEELAAAVETTLAPIDSDRLIVDAAYRREHAPAIAALFHRVAEQYRTVESQMDSIWRQHFVHKPVE